MVSVSDSTDEFFLPARPLAVRAGPPTSGRTLVVWVRPDDGVIHREYVIQLAALLYPFPVTVVTHRPDLYPATYVRCEVCSLWQPGIAGLAPESATRPALVGRSPNVPFLCYAALANVVTIAHEVGHVLGLFHRDEDGWVMSGPKRVKSLRWHPDEVVLGRKVANWHLQYWFSSHGGTVGGWNMPAWTPPVGWEYVTHVPAAGTAGRVTAEFECGESR